MFGHPQTEKTRKQISKAHKGRFLGDKNPNYGKGLKGEKNGRWQGGISFEPYGQDWTPKFRRSIRKRDNQVCMLCGIHREKFSRALDVHHINADKKMNIPQNCISLCVKCHLGIVHKDDKNKKDKENWIKLLQEKLTRLHGYQYSETNEIILEIK